MGHVEFLSPKILTYLLYHETQRQMTASNGDFNGDTNEILIGF
jgi:hypothetical protein